jgi:hypothetical protein
MWCEGLSLNEWEQKYDDTKELSYLHGRCDEWLVKNYRKHDKCVTITEYRDKLDRLCLMHCCLLRDDEYIDVRGNTKNFQEIIDAFDYGEYNVEIYNTLNDFKEKMKQLGIL